MFCFYKTIKLDFDSTQHYYCVTMIPEFDKEGYLPPGIYWPNWDVFVKRFGFNKHRLGILEGLKRALQNFQNAGCENIYIDGSFVTNKEFPDDFDGCWDTKNVNPDLLDPVFFIFDNKRAAQKVIYNGEFFPASFIADKSGRTYLDFFQSIKYTDDPKGIIAFNLKKLELK